MESTLYRVTLFTVYQLTVLVGILLLPVAVVARRAGISLPFHRLLKSVEEAYRESATDT